MKPDIFSSVCFSAFLALKHVSPNINICTYAIEKNNNIFLKEMHRYVPCHLKKDTVIITKRYTDYFITSQM